MNEQSKSKLYDIRISKDGGSEIFTTEVWALNLKEARNYAQEYKRKHITGRAKTTVRLSTESKRRAAKKKLEKQYAALERTKRRFEKMKHLLSEEDRKRYEEMLKQ